MRPAVRPYSVFGTALALLCAHSLAFAQSNCQPLKDLANRCEGLQRQPNAAPDYELLGLSGSVAPENQPYPAELKIAYYRPDPDKVKNFKVREILHETFYEMRPKLEPLNSQPPGVDHFGGWATGDVMQPNHVRLDNLGILIRLDDPSIPDLLAPAFLYSQQPSPLTAYTIHMVVHKRMMGFQCTLVDKSGQVIKGANHCTFNKTKYLSSEPVRITIPAAGLPEGLITAHIGAEYADDESGHKLDLDVRFLNEPLGTERR